MAGVRPAEREPKPAADVYILSYPKTGRTWLRALVGKALCDRYGLPPQRVLETEALTAMAGLPRAGFYHDGSAMIDALSWRELAADKAAYRGKRVLLLGRDVRDTLVSAYFQATRRVDAFDGPIGAFVRDDRYGVEKIARVLPAVGRRAARARRVRVPALRGDACGSGRGAAHGARVHRRARRAAGGRSTPPSSSGASTTCAAPSPRTASAATCCARRPRRIPESFKVRRGKVGGFRDYLAPDDVACIDACEAARGCAFTRPHPGQSDPA